MGARSDAHGFGPPCVGAGAAFTEITPPQGKYYRVDEKAHRSFGDGVGLFSREAQADPNVGAARTAAEAACRGAARAEPGTVATRPRAGTAVVWYHELGRGRAVDPLAWHAGCFVRGSSGVTRWGIQKFKEHPTGAATPDAFYEAMEAHVAAFEAMEVDAVAHAAAETSASRVSRAVPVGTGGRSDT